MPVTIDVPGLGPVSIPDEIPSEQADQYVRQIAQKRGVKLELPAPEPVKTDKSYGLGAAAQDIGVSALGLIPGVIETVSAFTPTDRALRAIGAQQGIAGLLPETEIGKDVGKYGVLAGTAKSLRDLQQELYSKESEVARQEFAKKLAEQEGSPFGEAGVAFKETLTTPELMTTQLPESLLSIIGGRGLVGFGGKVLKAATPQVVKEAGERAVQRAAEKIGEEGVEKIAKISGGPETVKTVLGGAAMQGGSVSNQNFIATMDMPQSKLAATPEYQEAIASGMSPEEARLSVARGAANGALAPATALSIVAQYAIPGGTSFERLFAGATQRTLGKEGALEIAKQIGKATLGEAGSEALEEGGGQFIANVFAPGQEDLTQGVGAAAGAAGALGALMGGGAGGVQALQASRANKIMAERQQQEEEARQKLDARMPPVQQIESPEPAQLPLEQIRTEGQGFVSNLPAGSTFTLDDIIGNTGATASPDAIAVANDLLNRGEIVRQPGDTLSFRRVNDDERVIPLGSPDQSYVYTVPTTREGTELNDGYTVESSALGVTRQVENQEKAEKIKQAMIDRAGQQAAVVDEQLNNLRAQADEVSRTITEAYTRPDISDVQLQQLRTTGEQTTQKLNDEIAKLEEQKATILAEPIITPINPRAETGHQVRLHTPGQPARILSNFANEQEAYDAIIDNSTPEQDRLIAEDPAYEAVRNRLEERAAELDAEEEPQEAEPVEMTPEMQGRVTQTANRMRGVLDQMGLKNIGLNVQQKLQEMVNGKLSAVDGYYLNRVISASLEGSRDVTATIGHETIHALRELGMFSDKEWEILTKRAQSEWIKKYGIRERYEGMLTEEKVIEEAIADAFGNWLQGDLQATGVIQGLFNRIKLVLEKMGSVLRGQGFTTSSDIFKRARTGTLEGDRVERVAEGKQYARDFKDVTVRTPELQQAAERLKAGEITSEEYNRLVDKYKPIAAFKEVPAPATKEEMSEALTSDKVARIGEPSRTLKGGESVGLRLDIPAYRDYGTWVVSVHEKGTAAGAGKSIGYEPVAAVTNANFSVNPKAALNIAAGKPKATIATVEGKWKPVDVKQAYKQAKEAMTSPDWIQVGMDPERHSYFYNRDTTQPVVSADEVIQIGGLVLAKNPVYAEKSEFQFALPQTVNVDGVERPTRISEEARAGAAVSGSDLMEGMGIPEEEQSQYWRNLSQEERDSLFEKYYRSVSGAGRAIHPTVEGVKNFWRWFGNSKIVNKDGTPKVMYHGTARDISEFRKQQANAIFVTEDPEFARTFADMSLGWMVKNATQVLDDKTLELAIDAGITEAVLEDAVTNKFAKEWLKDHEGFSLKNILRDVLSSPMSDYVSARIQDELPSKDNIIQLYVRAEKTFDYDSQEDRDALMAWAKSLDKNNPARQFIEDKKNEIEFGEWEVIESPAVQDFIKSSGYDSFYMYETGRKNLAVYDPNQLKSAIGNTGAFSRDSGEIQYALPLTPEETQDIVKRAKGDARLAQILDAAIYLTPEERLKLRSVAGRANAINMVDTLAMFPSAEEYAAIAYAGRAKRGWYENSAKALVSVFGGDAPRFAALLAALSPQCSVQTNLLNALNLWKNWTAAGRPQDRASIMRIAGQSVQGDKGEKSVLDAWKNNSVSALTAKDFTNFKLSGPKVNSFYLNLIGVTNEVTNDAWMSNFANLDQEIFSGSLNKAGTDPGKGPGYLAGNIVVRQAAERLTELTGEKWTPAEVQETVWSWAKALYEGAEAEGLSPIQFLTEGRLTEELINSVPDFSQLFYSDIYASILRSAGYGEQVDGLIQQRNANRAELSDQEQGVAVQTAPFAPVTQKELEKSAAKRLTALEEVRQKESTLNRVFKESPMAIFEARPSESLTQLVPSLRTGDRKLIKKFTNGAKSILFDSDGRDRIAKILGFDIGLPKKKGDETKHRVGSGGFEGKVSANYQVRIPEEFANPYSAATGYVFLQDAVPWQKLDPEGWGFGLAITIPKLNDEIEHEFFSRFEGLTDTGHTRAGNTILVGNFTNYKEIQKATKTQKGIEQANIDDELFKSIVCQIANEIAVKHGVRVRVAGYRFNGNLLENNIEDENGKEVNAWATTGTGAGYLRGDVAERLAPVQDQLDDLQSEFLDYCRAFQEEQDRKGKRKVKGGEQFALPQNILGQPARLPTWTYPTDSKYDNVIYYLMDKMIDLKRVIEGISKSGTKILDQWNPYLKEELYHGRTAEQTERFLRTEIRPLLQDLSRNNITIAELEEYLHNRHAEERNIQIASINPNLPDGGSGITTHKANNYLNALPQARRMLLERLARRVDDINKGTRDILVKSGLETPQTIAAWENTYKKYVPLFREDADYVTSSGYGVGEGFSVRGDFAKRAVGSTRGVIDIFANVVTQRERAIIRAEKNRVAKAVYGLAVQNPNKQFWMVIDPEGIKDPNQVRADLMNLGIDPNDVANIFQQPTRTQPDPRTGLVTNKLDPFVLKSDNVMAVRIDGKNKYVLFNNNDPSAKRMVTAIKNMDADQLGRVMSTLGMVTRWIASVNTQYNPIFGVVNFTRDIQGALLNLSTTPIADKASDVMSVSNVSGALKGIWSTSRAEKSGGALPTSQWAKLWQDFKDQGGQTGFRSQFSTSEERAKALEKEINYINAGKPRKAFTAMIDVLSDYNTAMENAVRLTAYKAALDKGISKEQAASIAKNLTVNFNKKGQVATQMGALYAFFNASMRGSVRLYETLTGPMGQKIIWGGLLLGAMQAMMLAAAGFDEDEPPEFVKDRNLILPLGYFTDKKNYISIPLPLGFNVLPNLSRNMVEWWQSGFKDPAKRIAHITGSMLDTFNPMGNAGWSIQTVAPTALDPFAALFENKDSFGRPIAREDISGLDPTPGYTRTKDVATTLGKGIAQFLNAASGGTKYKPGVISPTGDQIDFLAGQAGGGIYRELAKVEQTITSKATGEELPSYKMPLVGRFYGNADENAAQSQRFYSNLTRLNEHENEIKGRLKNREPLGDYFKEYPEARLIKMANSVEYNIRKLKQRRQLLKERGGNEQAIKNINDNIVRLMKRLNERVESTED